MYESTLTPTELERFFKAYYECALWSTVGEDGENLMDYELAVDTHNHMLANCLSFTGAYAALLQRAARRHPDYTLAQAGCDFWLTRNRHGAGYWDRGLGRLGQWLTKVAHAEGGEDLYVGDDGFVHHGY